MLRSLAWGLLLVAAPGSFGVLLSMTRPTAFGATLAFGPGPRPIPAIVFVSREPAPGGRIVPGLGPVGRTIATGGRLMVREANGRLRELLAPGALYDVADPAVSFDARRIAFAGTPHPDSAWRIYLVGFDGSGLRALTRSDRGLDLGPAFERYDDFDPCWIGERQLCFASTRYPLTAQYAEVPASNLFVIQLPRDGSAPDSPRRITSERNGAEEPTLDPKRGEIVFARWWFNRFEASATGLAGGHAEALPRDSVNLWEAVALREDGLHLACGGLGSRRALMAYQPAFLE